MTEKIELSEKQVDDKLKKKVESFGGWYVKIHSGWFTGLPDRLVIVAGVAMRFCELKGRGGSLSPRQKFVIRGLRRLGVQVTLIWNEQHIKDWCEKLEKELKVAGPIVPVDNSDLD